MKNALRLTLAAAAMTVSLPALCATDMFLKLEGIEGESFSKGHEKEIEVSSWSWGMSRDIMTSGSARAMGRPCVSEIVVTKLVDKASPKLMTALVNGTAIKGGKLTVRKGGEVPVDYLVIELATILVSSLQESGSSGDTAQESVALSFVSANVSYTVQGPDGKPGEKVPAVVRGANC